MNRILVEDNVSMGNLKAASLASYDVTVVDIGPDALVRASQLADYDLLTTDCSDVPGDEVAAKAILLPGFGDCITVDPSAVDVQMSKPLAPDALRDTVKQLIGGPAAID